MGGLEQKKFDRFTEANDRIIRNITSIIYGQDREVRIILATLYAGGHILLEDMPGTGKTTLALLLSKSIKEKKGVYTFRRIQFTPDLLPMDITGSNIFNQQTHKFLFRQGPVFTHILLADELNRASPKVQSALLECMAEKRVTVENQTYELRHPFFVIATQNPVETEGTYNLPIAQLDRFFARISLSPVSAETNKRILKDYRKITGFEGVEPAVTTEEIVSFQTMVDDVHIEENLIDLIVSIVHETRSFPEKIMVPASPRASIYLLKLCKAWAMVNGRTYVEEQDVKDMAFPCLNHRLKYHYSENSGDILRQIIDSCVEKHLRTT